jgi:hypothetical protein
MVQAPLRSARWPRFDTHVGVVLPFAARPNGLPTDESLTQLREVEDRVIEAVGTDGEVVGHETTGGTRQLHVYVDGTTAAADAVTRVATAGPFRARTKVTYDPEFATVAHLSP